MTRASSGTSNLKTQTPKLKPPKPRSKCSENTKFLFQKMKHTHNLDSEALIVARYPKTNPYININATPTWTGIFDPSFRVLILPRYLGVQTAIVPIPSSRRITSSEYEQEQEQRKWRDQQREEQSTESESKNTRESSSPTLSILSSCSCSCSCISESSYSALRTSSSSSVSSYTSISSTTISSTTNSTHTHTQTHPPNPSTHNSLQNSLHTPQLSPKSLASPVHFSEIEIQDTSTRTSIPKPPLDILSDSNTDSDSDCDADDDDDDDYEDLIDENDAFQPAIKDNAEEDATICDLMERMRKMSL
ncbi:hypothetical protein BTUL_0094g00580 [Botrytis tulipae]|uniref:Uncharacterized protein n=1 Tax=Botrytis tulipae TaxID=87230 RepID=A0A4Z1EP24_9HELO|nr:hypothetical protein BTUL_0094g00580 [Botrytis tulipae]